jgi:hypothetical protein
VPTKPFRIIVEKVTHTDEFLKVLPASITPAFSLLLVHYGRYPKAPAHSGKP